MCTVGIVVLASAGAVAAAAARPGRVVMRDDFLYKPHEFPISGDGDYSVRTLRWRSWGGKIAVADGQAVEQQRPSQTDHVYRVRVTLSLRTYCANLQRTVYNKISARILGPNPGVFGERTAGRVYTVNGHTFTVACTAGAARRRQVHIIQLV